MKYEWGVCGPLLARVAFVTALIAVSIGAVLDLGHSPVVRWNDKFEHIGAFALLAFLACAAYPRAQRWQRVFARVLCFGLLIECVQWWLPWREFSLLDLAADALGLCMVLALPDVWIGRRPPESP